MKSAKFFIVFTFLLAFAFQVSAQNEKSKIGWKNLQEKYERFEDIKPVVLNDSNQVIYLDSYYIDSVRLLKFFKTEKVWVENPNLICGHLSKAELKAIEKRKFQVQPNSEQFLQFDEATWKMFIFGDGFLYPGFKSNPSDMANSRYKFRINYWFDISKKVRRFAQSESPEFEVIEKDFKK